MTKLILTFVLGATVAVACGSTGHAAQTPPVPKVFVSPSGNDSRACTRPAPCLTFNRAYRVAKPGEVVEVAGGTYPEQTIVHDPAKTSPDDVVIQPAPGATVTLTGRLAMGTFNGDGPKHLTIKNLHAVAYDGSTPTGWQAGEGTEDVTWVNLDASNFYIRGVKDFHIVGGDWGPCIVPTPVQDACNNNKIDESEPPYANDNITIDGAKFHNMQCPNHDCASTGVDVHFECLYVAGGTNIKIRNSTFSDCEFYDIFVTRIAHTPAGAFDGLVIERNWLDTPWDGRGHQNRGGAVAFKPNGSLTPFSNITVRRNSSPTGLSLNDDTNGATYTNFVVDSNLIRAAGPCYPSVTYVNNIWGNGEVCGSDRPEPPFGYTLNANGSFATVPAQAATLQTLFAEARKKGATYSTIVRAARRLSLPAPGGRPWDVALVRSLLADRIYAGGLWGAQGAHPAVIPAKTWNAVQKLRLKIGK